MELSDVPPGAEIAIDANLLVYHFTGRSAQCSEFLSRVASGEVQGWIGAQALAELTHRLMILEAQSKNLIRGSNPARQLGERPQIVASLTDYAASIRAVPLIVTEVVPLTLEVVERSAAVRQAHGLLTNDSLLVAMMELRGTTALATADADFREVPGIQVYSPSDLAT